MVEQRDEKGDVTGKEWDVPLHTPRIGFQEICTGYTTGCPKGLTKLGRAKGNLRYGGKEFIV